LGNALPKKRESVQNTAQKMGNALPKAQEDSQNEKKQTWILKMRMRVMFNVDKGGSFCSP